MAVQAIYRELDFGSNFPDIMEKREHPLHTTEKYSNRTEPMLCPNDGYSVPLHI
jgi:hypothetical protein